jgi:predicted membrane channel-forming protein YqfA (hemolysin III family)
MTHLRWLRNEAPFVLVAAILLSAVGYLVVWPDHWRRGVGGIVLALLVAGVLRIVLPTPRSGVLAVRAKWFDAVCYLSLGVVILAVALRLH